MQEGAAHVEVVLAAAHEQQAVAVDDDAEPRHVPHAVTPVGAGFARRRTASHAMPPVTTSSMTALTSAARIECRAARR